MHCKKWFQKSWWVEKYHWQGYNSAKASQNAIHMPLKPIQYSTKNGRFFFTNSKDNYLSVILSYLGYYFISITFYSIESIRRLWSEKLNCGFFQFVHKTFLLVKMSLDIFTLVMPLPNSSWTWFHNAGLSRSLQKNPQTNWHIS